MAFFRLSPTSCGRLIADLDRNSPRRSTSIGGYPGGCDVYHRLPSLRSHTVQRALNPIERFVDIVQGVLG